MEGPLVLEVEFGGGGGSGRGGGEGGMEHFDGDGNEGLFVVVSARFCGGGLGSGGGVVEASVVVVGVVAHGFFGWFVRFDDLGDSIVWVIVCSLDGRNDSAVAVNCVLF